jgi:hypothetical protein
MGKSQKVARKLALLPYLPVPLCFSTFNEPVNRRKIRCSGESSALIGFLSESVCICA